MSAGAAPWSVSRRSWSQPWARSTRVACSGQARSTSSGDIGRRTHPRPHRLCGACCFGRELHEVVPQKLTFANGEDPIGTSLEWGVRVLGREVRVEAEGDQPAEATADVFPAYDEDGGLLLVLTPKR